MKAGKAFALSVFLLLLAFSLLSLGKVYASRLLFLQQTLLFANSSNSSQMQEQFYYITFNVSPSNAGYISFNGAKYLPGSSNSFMQGNYQISAIGSGNFIFSRWISTSNAIFSNLLAQNATVTLNGNAVIEAAFNAIKLNATTTTSTTTTSTSTSTSTTTINATKYYVSFNVYPSNAGYIRFSNMNYSAGGSAYLIPGNYQINAVANRSCIFAYWATSGNASLSNYLSKNSTLFVYGNSVVYANFSCLNLSPPVGNIFGNSNSIISSILNKLNSTLKGKGYVKNEAFSIIPNAVVFNTTLSSIFGAKSGIIANVIVVSRRNGVLSAYNLRIFSNSSNSSATAYLNFSPANTTTPILYSNSGLHEILAKVKQAERNVSTRVSILNTLPSNLPGFNLKYYKIFLINSTLNDSNVESAEYNFSVSRSWIDSIGISPSQVTLYKYISQSDSWVPLPTVLVGENSTSFTYISLSNSLSTYLVSYSTGGVYGDANPESVTLPAGYKLYICAAGANYTFATSAPAFSWTADVLAPLGATALGSANASVGHQTINICSAYTTGAAYPGLAVAGIGLNETRYKLYTSAVGSSTSASLTYTVATSNSFVVIAGAAGYYNFTTITLPTGCSMQVRKNNLDTYETAFIATCQNAAAGSFTVSASLSYYGSAALAAYVFPPYNVIFNDNPSTATIFTNGQTLSNGALLQIIGTNSISAISPTTGNWVFNSWSVSNSLNLTISNTLAQNTYLTVMGSGTVTATWNGITKFFETGLPAGTKWSVTYDGVTNSSTTNTIIFSTLPGTYTYSVPLQMINGKAYEPSPASGSLYSGNAATINFVPFSASISNPSNSIVDVGQYETFTASIYNGTSPYTYNILVVNSITPSIIAHNDLISGSTLKSVAFTFQVASADVSNSPEEANIVATDSFPATVNSIYSSTFKIYPAMATPSISPSSAATYSTGQTVYFSTSFTGGAPPYTYNWIVVNSITGSLIANALYTGVYSTSNTFAWTIPSADAGNTVVGNVIVTDSASTPATVNSVESGVISITTATCTISLNLSSISFGNLNAGSTVATNFGVKDSNSGGSNAYMYIYGSNWIGPGSFGVSNTTWSKSYGTAYSSAQRLGSLFTNTTILVPASGSNSIYFGLGIPGGTAYGAYTQNIVIENSC